MTETVIFHDFMGEKPDLVKPLRVILAPYRSKEYLNQIQNSLEEASTSMPINLLLMTPYFEFNFVDFPNSFLNLQTEYYKRPCSYCQRKIQDSVTCLLCGATMCWYKIKDEQCHGSRSNKTIMGREGLISYHTRVCEGGSSVYLHTSSGNIIFVQNGTPAIFETPYKNKYGELADPSDKNWDSFQIDEQGGGQSALL